jgi:spermidine synthase
MDYLVVGLIGALAFSLELLATKSVLPMLGGSAQTWIGSLMFFQLALFLSYGINFYLIKGNKKVLNLFLIFAFLVNGASLLTNQVIETSWPLLTQMLTLGLNYGLIFMALLMISPQLQLTSNKRALNFYVASNVGSLLGLFVYPLVVEPLVGLNLQKNVLLIGTGLIFTWFIFKPLELVKEKLLPITDSSKPQILLWSALGTILLGAFSASLIQDIISFPLLWVLPLSIYLYTFTWAFSSKPWGEKFISLRAITILELIALVILTGIKFSTWVDIGVSLILFTAIMLVVQHYLAKSAPENKAQLPSFYYLVGLGGLLGGLTVNLLVPLVFVKVSEYLFFIVLTLWLVLKQNKVNFRRFASFGVILFLFVATTVYKDSFLLDSGRSFYGLIRVVKLGNTISMYHGQIVHGQEFQDKLGKPTSYYQPLHVGDLFKKPKPKKVLIIGLGAGVLLHYLDKTQSVDIIEIDPLVVEMAKKHFSFIKTNKSKQRFIIGDGRWELSKLQDKYDLIVVDAFNGDAIPMHLLTEEAFAVYRDHLNDGGTLAMHLSNNYLDLKEVVSNTSKLVGFHGEIKPVTDGNVPAIWSKFKVGAMQDSSGLTWTDDFSSIISVLKK